MVETLADNAMQLTLQVHSYCGEAPQDSSQRIFDSYPVIIGRSSSCDYVLQDVSKYISSNHALISLAQGGLVIQDTSANGVFINGSTESVGRGNTAAIRHGDTVTMGDYCLRVTVRDAASQSTNDPFDDFYEPDSANAVTSVKHFHAATSLDHDWTPPSKKSEHDDWDLTLEDDRQSANPGTASSGDSDWADWEPAEKSPPVEQPRPPRRRENPKPKRAPIPIDSPRRPPINDSQGTISGHDALNEFLRGAGLDPRQFSDLDDQQLMREAGELTRMAIDCIVLLMKSRGELKNAIRADVTRISQHNNNPLKVLPNGEEALYILLSNRDKSGYLAANESMSQAVEDLQLHHLAMLDGMKAAVRSLLSQFDPDRLESRLEQKNPIAANIPFTREAKLWHLFNEKFSGIREEALDDFNELFGQEFRKAYEKRIRAQGRLPDF